MFANKTFLSTGGTGTFGNAVLKRFLQRDVAEIRVMSRDEKKQEDMRLAYNSPKLRFYIGDVRDADSVAAAMAGVNYVFHAAALKQVPSCEFFSAGGHQNECPRRRERDECGHQPSGRARDRVVDRQGRLSNQCDGPFESADGELMVAKARFTRAGSTILCGTRYGNVMASRGSVLPLFIQQVKDGKPLTVTDPNMTRFMMSIDDAVDLVLYAFQHGEPGDIFVQKAPAATLETLALAVKTLFSAANPIHVIGTRHGEKLYETLVTREERANAEDLEGYFRIPADSRDLNYSAYFTEGQESISHQEDYHSHNTRRLAVAGTAELLLTLDVVRDELQHWNRAARPAETRL